MKKQNYKIVVFKVEGHTTCGDGRPMVCVILPNNTVDLVPFNFLEVLI